MTNFRKPPTDISQQIELLQEWGLSVPDLGRAHRYLANISYYRLSAYMRPLYQPGLAEHRVPQGTMGFPERWDEDPFWSEAIRNPR